MHDKRRLSTGNVGPAGRLIAEWGNAKSHIDGNGYRMVSVGRNKYRGEHRIVMAEHISRDLYPFENVHHKNGLRADNRLENLELWAKPQTPGQRVEDLVVWTVQYYPDLVRQALAGHLS